MPELKPCPFCGSKSKIVQCDDEGNVKGEEYESNPWSGLGYRVVHESDDCPISTGEDGYNLIYDSREEAESHWNRRANECDRDELPKVADEIGADAEHIAEYLDSCEGNFTKDDADEYYKLAGWHDRIRKTLGVE